MSVASPTSDQRVNNTQVNNTSYTDARTAIDARQTNDNHSVNMSIGGDATGIGSGSIGSTFSNVGNTTNTTTNVTTTDLGAVQAAFASNTNTTAGALDLAKVLFSKSQQTLDANVQLAGELASGANQAYSDATAQATGNKSLIMVAIAAVALVAVVMLKKH
jgi:hypothetical protein